MNNQILEDYVERIFLFARARTYSTEEAEELSQEILFEACKNLNSLRDESLFEPWLFGLANNVLRMFKRKKGREHDLYVYDADLLSELIVQDFNEDEETYAGLRRILSCLSSQYRQILIMHYFDGLSCTEIAKRLNVAEGTIKWRLSEGRNHNRKEWNNMNEFALKPKRLIIRISGAGNYNGEDRPFPWQYISDAVSQNILWQAYEKPKTIEELSMLTGIPAFYIEDSVDNLVRREALLKVGTNKYQTNFIILTEEVNKQLNKVAERVADRISDKFLNAIDASMDDIEAAGFYSAGKSKDELKWLFIALAIKDCADILNPISKNSYKYTVKYDGNTWAYYGNDAESNEFYKGISVNGNSNAGTGGTYSHIVFQYNIGGDSSIFFSNRGLMSCDQISLCEKLITGSINIEDKKEMIAQMIENGYLERKDGDIVVTMPVFNYRQKLKFDEIVRKNLLPIAGDYRKGVLEVSSVFESLFPRHLENDVKRFSAWMYMWFSGFIAENGVRKGKLKAPQKNASFDAFIQWRE